MSDPRESESLRMRECESERVKYECPPHVPINHYLSSRGQHHRTEVLFYSSCYVGVIGMPLGTPVGDARDPEGCPVGNTRGP